MRLAFCLYKYFPFGGLQRDFLRIAQECHQRGHSIRVYTLSWQGEKPDFMDVKIVPVTAIQNHILYQRFSAWVENDLKSNPVDAVIGFNKMPNLDVYYAADPCYAAKANNLRLWWYKFTTRYRHFFSYEKSVFDQQSKTHVLMISNVQKPLFQQFYRTPENRLHFLPPGIARDRIAPPNAPDIREQFRREFNIGDDEYLLLSVGSGFKTKGVDRSLIAIAALPEAIRDKIKFMVIGQDNPAPFHKLIKKLSLEKQVTILSGRDDIPRFLLAADLLLHPAYSESAGMILLEALVAGLPVLVTDVCGYAHYISEAQAGDIAVSPFDQIQFTKQLQLAIENKTQRQQWQYNALTFSKTADIFSMPEKAADVIEEVVAHRG
jgi:UDP-glucose:(heptosyl)LPS alpha-1,3-glucosyltransferase